MSRQVRRVETPDRALALDAGPADYTVSFEAAPAVSRTPEDWLRTVFAEAPMLVRWYVVGGWRYGLLLALRPRSGTDRVLGWRVVSSTAEAAVIEASGPLVAARNVVEVDGDRVVLSTLVRYQGAIGRVVWAVAAVLHVPTIKYLLRRAAS